MSVPYLSYSGFHKNEECPKSYWHGYINKTQISAPDNRIGALYGSIVGGVFENFYTQRVWRSPKPADTLLGMVDEVTNKVVRDSLKKGVLNWKDPKYKKNGPHSMDEVLDLVKKSIPNGLDIIRRHKLVGTDAKAELKLDTVINGSKIGGRSDFVMTRISPHDDLIIVDGKGSMHRDKYVDNRQLLWYAMLYRKNFNGRIPDKLGFLYWREEPDTSIDWVVPSKEDLDELQDSVKSSIETIQIRTKGGANEFPARARHFNCKFCPYLTVCPEGQEMLSPKPPAHGVFTDEEDVTLD